MPRQPLPGGGWGARAWYGLSTSHGMAWMGFRKDPHRLVVWGDELPTLWSSSPDGPYRRLDTTGRALTLERVDGVAENGLMAALINPVGLFGELVNLAARTQRPGLRPVRLTVPGASWVMSDEGQERRSYRRSGPGNGEVEVAQSEDYHLDIDPAATPLDCVAVAWLHRHRGIGHS